MDSACCTCAQLLAHVTPIYDEKTEKPKHQDRRLDCCERVICGNCIHSNHRFATYCKYPINALQALQAHCFQNANRRMNTGPFCQISTKPSSIPQGLKDPPAYTPPSSSNKIPFHEEEELPSYPSLPDAQVPPPEKSSQPPAEDVLHFLDHSIDTVTSLSFRYGVPLPVLRRTNNITSDHLLQARRTVVIPGMYYKGGVSLSPRPVEGEEEERRKGIIRRWMVACKVAEYVIPSPCAVLEDDSKEELGLKRHKMLMS